MSRPAPGVWEFVREHLLERIMGTAQYRLFRQIKAIEPLLLQKPTLDDLSPVERDFLRCSDIYAHLPTLFRITVEGRRRRILELGVRTGDSTVVFLAAANQIGGHVTSVDAGPCPEAHRRVEERGLSHLWTFHQADDLALPWDEPVDHLFIDTSHEYDHTLGELAKFEPFVAPGGVVTLHDLTRFPGVWRAAREYLDGRDNLRVFRYFHNNGLAVLEKVGPSSES